MSAACRSGRRDINGPDSGLYGRLTLFLSFLAAPTIGYGCARVFDGWSRHQTWAEQMPLLRYGLGMASLALGGLAGYAALRLLFRLGGSIFGR